MLRTFARVVLVAAAAAGGPSLFAQAAPPPAQAPQDALARLERELQELRREYEQRLQALEERLRAFQAQPVPAPEPSPVPPQPAPQAPQDAVARLERELQELRREYEQRLQALEERLRTLQAQPVPAPEPSPVPPQPAPPPAPLAPTPLSAASSSKVFNPDIAVIGDFLGAIGKNDSPSAPPSLELHEAEAAFQAVVDPFARADFFLAFSGAGVEVEEGFITFTALPSNLLLKAGKMRASFGKVNQMHNHVLSWTERPLVTQNLVGGEEGISDAGLSLARLFANPVVYLEAIAEVYRGESEGLFEAPRRQDLTYVGRLRGYRDITESTNLDGGISFASGTNEAGAGHRTKLIGADLTFRYRPLRRAIYKRLLARTELVWSRRDLLGAEARAFGGYASADYQFGRRWFAGLRLDRSERADDPSLVDKGVSVLLSYWPSEFSQVRGQYRHTSYGEGIRANEVLFQLVFSIGAHGAHTF